MAVLLETVGELTASERFMPRSAGKSVNSLCANEESFFKKSWQKFSARYLSLYTLGSVNVLFVLLIRLDFQLGL